MVEGRKVWDETCDETGDFIETAAQRGRNKPRRKGRNAAARNDQATRCAGKNSPSVTDQRANLLGFI
jgi:hypothetical protein